MGGLLGVLITGCAATGKQVALPEMRPLGAQFLPAGRQVPRGEVTTRPSPLPEGNLKIEQALATALLLNPELTAFSHEVRAAEARVLQAGVLPNPELEVELEEYDRGGGGLNSAEIAVGLGQLFELGGKRRWRIRMAEARGELAGWDYESKRLDVFAETAQRFTAVLAAQRRVELVASAEELAEKTSRAVAERVKAGKEPPLQASKSEAELEMARMEAQEASNSLQVARRSLAAMWGAEQAGFTHVEGDLNAVPEMLPSLESLRPYLARSPDLARWGTEMRLREAALASEKAARIPDLESSVGYLQFEEDGTDAFAFGVGVPLPIFDRNRGNITAAGHELVKVDAERTAMEVALATELAETHAALLSAQQRVETLRQKVVPAMEEAYAAAHEGYRQGKFGFLDMLDAQRGLVDAKGALVDALSDYHIALIETQRLTGTDVQELTNGKKED
jgi:cobalt-zinc-cadmium efflux system outer membrane protein